MLRASEENLVNLILHELTHSTVFAEGRAEYNENLASFVGTTGSLQYLRLHFGTESAPYRRAVAQLADRETFARYLNDLLKRLKDLYREEKAQDRGHLFRSAKHAFRRLHFNTNAYAYFGTLRLNNAEILAERRYANDEPFRRIFEHVDGDWPAFWKRIRKDVSKFSE